jgi:hypothetical protein
LGGRPSDLVNFRLSGPPFFYLYVDPERQKSTKGAEFLG